MKVHALTLAALATSAVPDLEILEYEKLRTSAGDEVVAALTTDLGELTISYPLTQAAEVRHSAEILALGALTPGIRESLPFAVPEVLGVAGISESRAVVMTRLDGNFMRLSALNKPGPLSASLARALASLHSLPQHTLVNQGIAANSTVDVREGAKKQLERAAASGLLPTVLNTRWLETVDRDDIWDFNPAVIHGGLSEEQIVVIDDDVSGIYQWHQLEISDPAEDLAWLHAFESWSSIIKTYGTFNTSINIKSLEKRAKFWHEFSIVRWLLFGIDSHDNEIIGDAVTLFDQLIDQLSLTTREETEDLSLSLSRETLEAIASESKDSSKDMQNHADELNAELDEINPGIVEADADMGVEADDETLADDDFSSPGSDFWLQSDRDN